MQKNRIKNIALIVLVFTGFLIKAVPSEALYNINSEAVRAVSYQESCVSSLRDYIEFYRICINLMSPNSLTGGSLIKGSKGSSSYDRLFANLEHNKEKQKQKTNMLWEDLIQSNEKENITLIVNTIKDTGREVFKEPKWPIVSIPGSIDDKDKKFSIAPTTVRYIIPAFTGVVTGSPSQFDDSMKQYLISGIVFYPIITLTVPVPDDIRKNKFKEEIFKNIKTQVPEAAINNQEEIALTIFPGLDSMQNIIQRTRELLLSSESVNNQGK